MQATHPNIYAHRDLNVEAFLYADVGAEMNGSTLTILSMIARLGRDPWTEAARWAALPRSGAIESLAQDIDQMPLVPSALAEGHATATRLVQLLPATTSGDQQGGVAKTGASTMPKWLSVTLLYGALALGMAVSGFLAPKPSQAIATMTDQPVTAPIGGAEPSLHAGPVAAAAKLRGPPSK